MIRQKSLISLVILLLFATIAGANNGVPYSYRSADQGQYVISTQKNREILPHKFLREYDPVTVFFKSEMVDSVGPELKGKKFLTIEPAHAGEYIWIDKKTLEFRPTTPWPPITWFEFKSGKEVKKLQTLLTPPKKLYPSNSQTDVGPIKEISLTFHHEVTLESLRKLVSFEVTPLPGIDRSKSILYTAADYQIKAGEVSNNGSVSYSFIFKKSFPLGHKVRTHVKVSEIDDFEEGSRTYSFDTKADFRPVSAGSRYTRFSVSSKGSNYSADQAIEVDRSGVLVVEFSSAIDTVTLSQAKSFFNFSPSPNSFTYSVSGNRITAEVDLDPERIYKVTLQPIRLRDKSRRKLLMDAPSSYYIYRNPDRSYIRWAKGYSILELNGPQHLPMSIANVNSFDLRIHKIDPLNKAFWPFPSSAVAVDEKQLPPGPGEEPENESKLWDPLSKSRMIKHLRMLGSPHYSSVVDVTKEGILRNQSLDLSKKLRSISKGKPGAYLIGFRELKNSSSRYFVKVLVTDLCLSTVESKNEILFTVTSYKTGRPVAGATVTIEGVDSTGFTKLFTATTDKYGFCKAEGAELYNPKRSLSLKRVVVKKGSDQLVLNTRSGLQPPSFRNNHWSSSYSNWLDWLKSPAYDFSKDREYRGFVCTERPMYRPGDSVHIKGYLRTLLHGKLNIPTSGDIAITVNGPSISKTEIVPLSQFGSYNWSYVEKKAPTGEYYISVKYRPNGKASGTISIASTNFRVDAYRIPRFEVKLTGPDRVPNDRPFSVNMVASYYAGGPVIGGDVRWRVAGYPYAWSVDGWEEYMLSSDSRFGGHSERGNSGTFDEVMETDEDGGATLLVQPQSVVGANPMKFVIEGTVTDIDEQTVTDTRSVIALPPYVLGLKMDRFIRGGSTINAKLVAIGQNEKLLAGQEVSIALKKMSWNSYLQESDFARSKPRFITDEQVHLIDEKTVKTGDKPVDLTFENQEPGVYIIECSSTDKLGRRQTLKIDLFLSGEKPVVWKKSEQRVFETVTDKSSYVPGEKASIIIKSPYQNGRALAIVEMPDGRPRYEWITISKGQGTFDLQITDEMIPHIPVSFLLMRPRVSGVKFNKDGKAVDPGKPETVANTTWITVKPTANRLKVSLEHEKKFTPGDTVSMTVNLKDWKGNPVSGEVALWLVDKAVLSLAVEKSIDPLQNFIPRVGTHVTIRDSRNMVLGMLGDFETPGGDGGDYDKDKKEQITVRKNFKTVPYYNPSIKVGANGVAKVTIPLPDNLTRFAIRAVAVSSAEKFGSKKSEVLVRLPVIVQPMLPRFVRVGDTIQAGGIARVVEGSGGDGLYSLETDGLDVLSTNLPKWSGFTFPGRKATPITVKMGVPAPSYEEDGSLTRDFVSLQMAVRKKTERGGDAFRVSIPILPDRRPITFQSVGMLTKDSSFAFHALTEPARPNTLMRKLMVSSEMPLLKTLGALRYLIEYPHGCTEQRVSRAYPALAYKDLWHSLGVELVDTTLDDAIISTLKYLEDVQSDDGLWGYWPGSQSGIYLTAYVVEFLALVDELNKSSETPLYPLNQKMYTRSIKALEKVLRSDYSSYTSSYYYYSQAAAALALARAGKTDIAYFRQLAKNSKGKSPLSVARIYRAVIASGGKLSDQEVALEKNLWNTAVFKLREGKEVFGGMQSGNTSIGAEVHASEITDIAGVMGALSLKNSEPVKVKQMRDALVGLGKSEGWGNTHVNSQVLLALRDNIKNSKKVSGLASYSVGGKSATITLSDDKVLKTERIAVIDSGVVKLGAGSKSDTLYTKLFERYLPKSLGSSEAAAQNGFVVKRELILPNMEGGPSKKTALNKAQTTFTIDRGTIIEEHIQVTNPKDRHYVAVVIPLAAGVEYLNPELKTAAAEFTPDGSTSNKGDYQMFLDDRIVYYFNAMSSGTYDFYFRVRATVEGVYTQPAAYAEMMYHEEINGNSPGARIVVKPRPEKKETATKK